MQSHLALIILGALAGFVIFWALLITLIGKMTGWRKLALRYCARYEPSGEKISWQSAAVGLGSYKGSLYYRLCNEGLYVVPHRIFRFGHPALLFPWKDVAAGIQGEEPAIFSRKHRVHFIALEFAVGRDETLRFLLPLSIVEKAQERGFLPKA